MSIILLLILYLFGGADQPAQEEITPQGIVIAPGVLDTFTTSGSFSSACNISSSGVFLGVNNLGFGDQRMLRGGTIGGPNANFASTISFDANNTTPEAFTITVDNGGF